MRTPEIVLFKQVLTEQPIRDNFRHIDRNFSFLITHKVLRHTGIAHGNLVPCQRLKNLAHVKR